MVDSEKERETKLYIVELVNQKEERKIVCTIGVNKISSDIPTVKISGVKQHLSTELQENW